MNKRKQLIEPLCLTSEKGEKNVSSDEMRKIKNTIGKRVIEAFNYQSDLEIAFLLRSRCKTIKSITEGEEFPPIEVLLSIHKTTGVSIHWLLTGEGTKYPTKDSPSIYSESIARESALLGLA